MLQLSEFETVTLNFPPREGTARHLALDCHILAFGWRTLALEAVDARALLRLPAPLPRALLGFDRRQGLRALRGHVRTGERLGDLRFVVDDRQLGRLPARTPSRVPTEGPISVTTAGATVEGRVEEISAVAHLTVACRLPAAPGDLVSLRFRLEEHEYAGIEARVLAVEPDVTTLAVTGRGSEDVRSPLAAAVVAYNRAALRRREREQKLLSSEF